MPDADDTLLPDDAPEQVRARAAAGRRVPVFEPALGRAVPVSDRGDPPHRLVVLGDSLSHGFQSGAIYSTDISYPAIIADELGWSRGYRYPRYGGPGGLPLNLELLLRDLEQRFGSEPSGLKLPLMLFRARQLLDEIEDYWERGAGRSAPLLSAFNHCLAVYGWDLRDALSKTAATCEQAIAAPNDDVLSQVVQNNGERAAMRVYPHWSAQTKAMTLLAVAKALGDDHDASTDHGIETLVVFLGANNALQTVTGLRVSWSGPDFREVGKKAAYTVWRPEHFAAELAELSAAVEAIAARHVIWCTVPHVTIVPIARGVGRKVAAGSRYFPFYTRPWIDDGAFDPARDPHITDREARAVDYAIDAYNDAIQQTVERAREGGERDWYMLDIAGLMDRLAARRYINDPNARPAWWTPYPLPAQLQALVPTPDSRFLTGDGEGGRATGGLFSLDGVHPTTVGYGLIAQELVTIMRQAGVEFRSPNGAARPDPVMVDFDRLIRRDSLVGHPPQNLGTALATLGWADEALDWVKRALP